MSMFLPWKLDPMSSKNKNGGRSLYLAALLINPLLIREYWYSKTLSKKSRGKLWWLSLRLSCFFLFLLHSDSLQQLTSRLRRLPRFAERWSTARTWPRRLFSEQLSVSRFAVLRHLLTTLVPKRFRPLASNSPALIADPGTRRLVPPQGVRPVQRLQRYFTDKTRYRHPTRFAQRLI